MVCDQFPLGTYYDIKQIELFYVNDFIFKIFKYHPNLKSPGGENSPFPRGKIIMLLEMQGSGQICKHRCKSTHTDLASFL